MPSNYEILLSMGKATPPITTYYNCYPSYISYVPWCTDPSHQPPQSCTTVDTLPHEQQEALVTQFTTLYPLFSSKENLLQVIHHVTCLYPGHSCIDSECAKARFFLLLAHYLTMLENPADTASAVASSSVGDTSISYDTSNVQGRSPFFLWLSKTPYGRQLLNILTMQGLPIVV